jgi:peptidoglycan/xylan/chitin deacetylase (PgdA/CDA1 family)
MAQPSALPSPTVKPPVTSIMVPNPTVTSIVVPSPTVTSIEVPIPTEIPVTAPAIDPSKAVNVIERCVRPGMFALTFDDGPSINIPALLTKLKELGVKATFFINALNYADFRSATSEDAKLVKAIFDNGHQIGTHTFSHKDLATLSTQAMWNEMRLNDLAIRRIIGKRPTHLRPPFLSTNAKVLEAMGTWGYKVVNTNLDTKDYENSGKPNEIALNHQISDPILNNSNPTSASFISLNHDFTTKIVQWTEEFVKQAQAKGYRLVTSAECIGDNEPYRT